MSDRLTLIAQLGAAIATADEALAPVLRHALAALVEDQGIIAEANALKAADEDRRARQARRTRQSRNAKSRDVTLHDVTQRDVTGQGSPAPQVSLLSPTPPNNPSFPPPPPTPSPTPATDRVIRVVSPRPEVDRVLARYVGLHPRRKPGPADRKVVEKALGWGYSADELCEALEGNAADEWHRGKKKHDLAYVLRNNGQIDNFRAKAAPVYPEIRDGWFAEAG